MGALASMPPVVLQPGELLPFGQTWVQKGGALSRTAPNSSMQLGALIDGKIGAALATMLGSIPVQGPLSRNALLPPAPDCVEVGACRIIGGVRPQNFDVAYRPDGVRFAFDSKTLNDAKSVQKNYQNMINDLATEATTVHSRFPYALVAFLVVVPTPCLMSPQREGLTGTLERLTGRVSPLDSAHRAEAIALAVWDPNTGMIDQTWPTVNSPLRLERFSDQITQVYVSRYKGLPPHVTDTEEAEAAE